MMAAVVRSVVVAIIVVETVVTAVVDALWTAEVVVTTVPGRAVVAPSPTMPVSAAAAGPPIVTAATGAVAVVVEARRQRRGRAEYDDEQTEAKVPHEHPSRDGFSAARAHWEVEGRRNSAIDIRPWVPGRRSFIAKKSSFPPLACSPAGAPPSAALR
ncbi:hypothetical protein [Vulgatibacter incomptus]|uniref:hypothetical protein n=1 Tax=Vulgatibacter incomptus TaxID=1391653 RepID=UPI0012F95DD5|nr:hypothetical protein [Vulgatibacter incomptus]